jgi:hypothetical protein
VVDVVLKQSKRHAGGICQSAPIRFLATGSRAIPRRAPSDGLDDLLADCALPLFHNAYHNVTKNVTKPCLWYASEVAEHRVAFSVPRTMLCPRFFLGAEDAGGVSSALRSRPVRRGELQRLKEATRRQHRATTGFWGDAKSPREHPLHGGDTVLRTR